MSSSSHSQGYGSKSFRSQGRRQQLDSKSQTGTSSKGVEMKNFSRSKAHHVRGTEGGSESQEYINGYSSSEQTRRSVDGNGNAMQIKREVTYTVESVSLDDCEDKEWPVQGRDSTVVRNGHPKTLTTVMHSPTRKN
jgi:hypothetical protein